MEFGTLSIALYYALVVLTVILAIFRNRETAAALAWCLAIVFLPFVGIAAFFAFGFPREPRRLKRKRDQERAFRDRIGAAEPGLVAGRRERTRTFPTGWDSVGRVAEELTGFPRREGNRVVLHTVGKEAFDAMFEAIRSATQQIHVLTYIFRHDRVGKEFLGALVQKARAGVKVRFLIDALGSLGAWYSVRKLRRAGGEGAIFGPFHFLNRWFTLNFRNHRKIVLCDGEVGFFGGLNVGDEYCGRDPRSTGWFDAHFELRGPAVRDLQLVFVEDWHFATGEVLGDDVTFPRSEPVGEAPVQIVSAGPHQPVRAIREIYFEAVARAERRLWIATPYFVPDAGLRDAIRSAALRGVEIVLLQQGRPPDYWLTYFASLYFTAELLCENVRLFEYQAGMMHAKMLVADGRWASVGTANFDNRSLRLNFELTGIFDGPREVRRIEGCFEEALARCREIRVADLDRRSWPWRVGMEGARLLSPLL